MLAQPIFTSILVAYDGTPAASRVVEMAMALAQCFAAKLNVLAVVAPLSGETEAEGVGLEDARRFRPRVVAEMARLAQLANTAAIMMTTEIVDGEPDREIAARAAAGDADLLVVGHRRIAQVRRWLEGESTAERVIRDTKIAVLVIAEPMKPATSSGGVTALHSLHPD